jgi:tetratricopeptide (TPR) repeat protein
MKIVLDARPGVLRVAALTLAIMALSLFSALALSRFVVAVASDPRVGVGQETLEAAAAYYPDSARVQARLAARLIETGVAQTESHEEVADRAIDAATRAVRLASWEYENWLLLAAARELKGDLAGAETALDESLKRAPNNVNARWRLANLLIREEKMDRAMDELRATLAADPTRLPATLGLLWQASGGRLDSLVSVAGASPKARLALTRFLIQQGRLDDAAAMVASSKSADGKQSAVDGQLFRDLPEDGGRLIDELLAAGQVEFAAKIWRAAVSPANRDGFDDVSGGNRSEAMWNGGFETPIKQGLAQFDWRVGGSEYARIVLAPQGRAGGRSLRIAYLGRETTKLKDEVRQMVLVSPGARYRLECYARAEKLVTPGGPQVVVTVPGSDKPIAATPAVDADTRDWRQLSVEFNAPPDARALIVSVRQTPQFSYVTPTTGVVWFDDFSLKRQ